MARKPRLDAPGVLHHVVARGIERSDIFRSDPDRVDLLDRIADASRTDGFRVLAWALMSNHLHLLLRSGSPGVSRSMQRVLGGYASGFNRRHQRCGHLFHNRFGSTLVEEQPYLLELVRYIHLNPVRAGIVPGLDALDAYAWTGHATLMAGASNGWQEVTGVLELFGKDRRQARPIYRRFVADGLGDGWRTDLVGGGVRSSPHGIDALEHLPRGRERWCFAERVLGSGDFLLGAREHLEPRPDAVAAGGTLHRSLPEVLRFVADVTGLSVAALCSSTKRPEVVAGRALAAFVAVDCSGLRTAEVAAAMHVSPRSIARLLPRGARIASERGVARIER